MSSPVWDSFCKIASLMGDKAAIIDAVNGQSISYRDLQRTALSFAQVLKGREEGAVVFVGEPDLASLPLVLACAAAGRCFVPLSDHEPVERLMDILSHLPGPLLVASAEILSDLIEVEVRAPLDDLGLRWQIVDGQRITAGALPFLVTHSSGSTGRAKAIAFMQDTKLKRTYQTINLFNVSEADIVLSPTPFHHSLGQRHFFISIMTGATLVKAYPFRADLWINAVRDYDVTFAIPVSTHLKILQSQLLRDWDILSSFRCIVTSSAPAEPEFKRAILNKSDFSFWEIYGMSETACATAVRYLKGDNLVHLGPAVLGSHIRIAADTSDGIGEIEVWSDCLCDGYWGDADRWSDALTDDGYFRSGDLGRLDELGNLIYLGRLNESFQCGGLVIFPGEIERLISELPQIFDCVAFGLPDPVFGNIVSLAYVAKDFLEERDLVKFFRSALPKHMWPNRLFRCDDFPKLSSGKVDRLGLIKRFSQ